MNQRHIIISIALYIMVTAVDFHPVNPLPPPPTKEILEKSKRNPRTDTGMLMTLHGNRLMLLYSK